MKKVKRTYKKVILYAVIAILLVLSRPIENLASEKKTVGMDVAIVVDTSGSMKKTDPKRIAIDAAKLFIDMMELSGSRVALVPFSDKLGDVIPMTAMYSQDDKLYMKQHIDALQYSGDTDIGLALKKGYDLLENSSSEGKNKAILFFTDGKIDLPQSTTRTAQESYDEALAVAGAAAKEDIPIYTIGLNGGGEIDEELIALLAEQTGGREYVVDSADSLPTIYDEIFADFINSNIISLGDFVTDGVNYCEIPFDIPDNSVMEANIIMLLDEPLIDVQVIDPAGNNLYNDSKKVIFEQAKTYALVKLLLPQQGEWLLRVKGVADCKIHVNLICNYQVDLVAELIEEEGAYCFYSWFDNGNRITDMALYEAFSGEVYLESKEGVTTYPMELKDGQFVASISKEELHGDYSAYIRVESDSMYRESNNLYIQASGGNVGMFSVQDFPQYIEMKGLLSKKEKIQVLDYIDNSEAYEISVGVDVSEINCVEVEVEGTEVVILPKENGSGMIYVELQEASGQSVTEKVEIYVDYTFMSILPLLLLLVLIIVAIVAVVSLMKILQKNKKRNSARFRGSITWTINGKRYGGDNRYELEAHRGLYKLAGCINDPEVRNLDLDKVTIRMNDKFTGLEVTNKSSKCIMNKGYNTTELTKTILLEDEFVSFRGKDANDNVTVELSYIR